MVSEQAVWFGFGVKGFRAWSPKIEEEDSNLVQGSRLYTAQGIGV